MASDAGVSTIDGETIVVPSVEVARCPYEAYASLRRDAPVHLVPGRDEWVLSRHEDVVFALRHPEIFSNEGPTERAVPTSSRSILNTDPPAHKEQRRLASRSFTPARIREYEPGIRRATDELIDRFAEAGEVEFVAAFAAALPIMVIAEIMGLPREDFAYIKRFTQVEGAGTPYLPPALQRELLGIGREMGTYLREKIEQRYADPGDDALSELVRGQVERDGELRLEYLVAEAGALLGGGVVSTAHMLTSTMLLLMRNPDVMARVRHDPSVLPRLLEESLRVEAPVQWQPRYTTQEVELHGRRIPAGARVFLLYGAANRDDRTFDTPEELDIDRENVKRHLSFGLGTHFCVGAPLARLEGTIAFERLLARMDDIRLSERNDYTPVGGVTFRGVTDLHLRFTPSRP